MNKLEKAVHLLLSQRPFYANFYLNSEVEFDNPKVDTAAAEFTASGMKLHFNREFLDKWTVPQVAGVVEHEILHLVFRHPLIHKTHPTLDKTLLAVAVDAAINQHIPVVPPGGVSLEGLEQLLGVKLLRGETWEYYYSQLALQQDKVKEAFPNAGHAELGKGTLPPGVVDALLAQAMDAATKASVGNVPEVISKAYGQFGKAEVPWAQVLRNFVCKATSTLKISTRQRANRRYELDQPGRKKQRELKLGVCVDSSGSVSDAAFQAFLSEVVGAAQHAQITLIEADCVVQRVETIKRGKKPKLVRTSGGGTAYSPAIEKCVELGVDAIVYCGDMDAADTPVDPRLPFLWVIVGSSNPPGNFGSVVRLGEK